MFHYPKKKKGGLKSSLFLESHNVWYPQISESEDIMEYVPLQGKKGAQLKFFFFWDFTMVSTDLLV